MDTVLVVLDTNTFLHYVSLEQVVWSQLFSAQNVVLFICPPVIRELNKHKDAPRTPKLRDRAADTLRKIDVWADSSSPIVLRDSVEVRFRVYDAKIDFVAHNLVREIADDHLIATLIELQAESSMVDVVLLTRDTGLKLKAKAHGFSVKSLPNSALLPDEVLPSEKKIKELELQVKELQNARPKLRLSFRGGINTLKLAFQGSKKLSDSDIATRMTALNNKYPTMVQRANVVSSKTDPYIITLNATTAMTEVSPESIRDYNQRLDKYFGKYEEYLEDLASFYDWESRTAAINIILVNDGSCPADDVDIFIHFPDGFQMFDESDYEKEPKAPTAPRRPKSILEEVAVGFPLGSLDYGSLYSNQVSPLRLPAGISNISGPKIKRTNSYDVRFNVRKSKHGIELALDVLYLTFESLTEVSSFTIDYVIHASNLPKRIVGTLNVIV